jgi:hypothetical protein
LSFSPLALGRITIAHDIYFWLTYHGLYFSCKSLPQILQIINRSFASGERAS